jgi:hypothetical protein
MRLGMIFCLLLVACNSVKKSTLEFTASGEILSLTGYGFPPDNDGDPAFVDGWEIKFEALLVTFDNIKLSENPDLFPSDQSQIGKTVSQVKGPWVVDLHKGGPLQGKGGGGEQAVAIASLSYEFDETKRYAFGFDIVPASAAAININLDTTGVADYALMQQQGWTVLYIGTATWKGTTCTTTNTGYDFTQLPTTVKFRFGFTSPTTYSNCQNPENDPAEPLGDEEHQRGIQIRSNAVTTAQLTVHTDHLFWESFVHDAAAHFDQLAALAVQDSNGDYVVTQDNTKQVNFTGFKDAAGNSLPWRACLASYTPPNTAPAMSFNTQGVPYNPAGDASNAIRDYYDFITYNQSTQGHLNADGLCYVQRNYPSPL